MDDRKEIARRLAHGECHDFEFDAHWNLYQNYKKTTPWIADKMWLHPIEKKAKRIQWSQRLRELIGITKAA